MTCLIYLMDHLVIQSNNTRMILFQSQREIMKYLALHLLLTEEPVKYEVMNASKKKTFCNFYYFATSIE